MLRELAWVLFGLALAAAGGLVTASLVAADTTGEAVRALLIVVLAAAVGIAAGHLSGAGHRSAMSPIGAAVVAVIAAVSRVNAIARPDFTLVLTAAVATCVALVSTALPPESRRGAQMGSLVGAALVVVGVVWSALATVAATVRAAITPGRGRPTSPLYAVRRPHHQLAGPGRPPPCWPSSPSRPPRRPGARRAAVTGGGADPADAARERRRSPGGWCRCSPSPRMAAATATALIGRHGDAMRWPGRRRPACSACTRWPAAWPGRSSRR